MSRDSRRRRFSDIFNPPERFREESSPRSPIEEEAIEIPLDSPPQEEAARSENGVQEVSEINTWNSFQTSSPIQEEAMEVPPDLPIQDEQEVPEIGTLTSRRKSTRIRRSISIPYEPPASNKPVKLTAKSGEKEIKKYYLDKKVKRSNPSLETIYEEPQVNNRENIVMSSRKFRRTINFEIPKKNSAKVKKRRAKANSLRTNKKGSKVTLKMLMEKLKELDE